MYKEIKLSTPTGETRTVPMLANAATPIRYKMIFGKDLLRSAILDDGEIDAEIVSKLAYLMSKQSAKVDLRTLNVEEYIAWLEDFDSMAFVNNAKEIFAVYMGSKGGSSKAKK